MERTLVIIKPDAMVRWIAGKIIDRLESKWLKLVACKMTKLNEEILKEHYSHLVDKPFFSLIVKFMTSAPVILQVWEWLEAVKVTRQIVWVTNARQAQPWTIRWDWAMSVARNTIHASESPQIAEEEIKRFFTENEIYSYKRIDESVLYEEDEK